MTTDGTPPAAPRTPGGPARRAAGDRPGHTGTGYPIAGMTASTDLAALAERTWERTLELNPTLATIYGDERYDDRLDDPGPAGRAARRALADETLAAAAAIPRPGSTRRSGSRATSWRLAAATDIADDETRMDLVGAVQQQGHQSLLPELVQIQKADTPERLERLLARIAAYPAVADTVIGLLEEGRAAGLTAARVVADRAVGQLERLLAGPAAASPIVTLPAVARRGRPGPDPRRGGAARPAGRRALPGGAAGLPAGHPRGARAVRDPGEAPSATRRGSAPTPASTSVRTSSTGSGSTSWRRSRPSAALIAGAAGYGDDTAAYRAALNADPAEIPPTPTALVERCSGGHPARLRRGAARSSRGSRGRAAMFAASTHCSRGTPPGRTTTRPSPTARGRHLLCEHVRPAQPHVLDSRVDDLPRGRAGPPLPACARDGAAGPAPVPHPRGFGPRGPLTWRAGRSTRSWWRTRPAYSGARPSASGRWMGRCSGLPACGWTPGFTRSAEPTKVFETMVAAGSIRPTPRARRTATPPGRARRRLPDRPRRDRVAGHEREAAGGVAFDIGAPRRRAPTASSPWPCCRRRAGLIDGAPLTARPIRHAHADTAVNALADRLREDFSASRRRRPRSAGDERHPDLLDDPARPRRAAPGAPASAVARSRRSSPPGCPSKSASRAT